MRNDIIINMPENPRNDVVQVVKNYGKKLFGFVRGKVSSKEDAEDILQEVWYQFSNIADISGLESISGWLYQVARNKITDGYRKKKTYAIDPDSEGFSLKTILLAENESPEWAIFQTVFWQELMEALDELPEKQRQVFILNELEDLTLQEIATQTGENLKTIISRKGYAVKHLRKRLSYLYNELNND